MKRLRLIENLMPITLMFWMASSSGVWAGHKAGHNGGGGNPGGGVEPAAYNIVAFEPTDTASLRTSISDLSNNNGVVGWEEISASQVQSWHLGLFSSIYTPLPGYATALNDVGQITVVMGDILAGHSRAYFLNSLAAEPVLLPPLPGDVESESRDINNDGYIIGSSWSGTGNQTAVAWRSDVDSTGSVSIDGPIPLSPLSGDSGTYVGEIGGIRDGVLQIVGTSVGIDSAEAVIWSLDLDTNGALPTSAPAVGLGVLGQEQSSYSHGWAIDAQGDVVGESDYLPFLKHAHSEIEALAVPRDAADGTWASDINEAGNVVGQVAVQRVSGARTHPRELVASLWRENQHVDLNTLIDAESGWGQLEEATRINDNGLIAGSGLYGVSDRGFVMVPSSVSTTAGFAVPEPSGVVLALLGMLLPAYFSRLGSPSKAKR